MDARKTIRKLRGGYVDWYGRPSTKEAYYAQAVSGAEDELHKKAVEQLRRYAYPPADAPDQQQLVDDFARFRAEDEAVVTDDERKTFNATPLQDTNIPHQKKLANFGIKTLGGIPSSQDAMQIVPGIGPKAALDIAFWFEAEWGIEVP